MAQENHRLPGFSFNVEEWDAEEQTHKTLANLQHARTGRSAFATAVAEKPE
jgi:hypothetical protein